MGPVLHVNAFEDNYIWLIRSASADRVAVVDPGDAAPVLAFLERERLTPAAILCTHHHPDHIGGIADLVRRYPIPVYAPAAEGIRGTTHPLREGDRVTLPELDVTLSVLEVPGHTRGHIAYYGDGALFCGDTLFSLGCGRLFEGTAEQLFRSLERLAQLPPATQVYCAHEYTADGVRFTRAAEPDNPDLDSFATWVDSQRRAGWPTLPTTIARERRLNPFLRTEVATVRRMASAWTQQELVSNVNVFAALRRWRDVFFG
jgi:hydroxyacylglutathione hydrolase